uniref:Uncharacterized protein n=1 Tax=Steinernema glaseri TaxID=37863 RepID=A0A1I7YAS3_9BILA
MEIRTRRESRKRLSLPAAYGSSRLRGSEASAGGSFDRRVAIDFVEGRETRAPEAPEVPDNRRAVVGMEIGPFLTRYRGRLDIGYGSKTWLASCRRTKKLVDSMIYNRFKTQNPGAPGGPGGSDGALEQKGLYRPNWRLFAVFRINQLGKDVSGRKSVQKYELHSIGGSLMDPCGGGALHLQEVINSLGVASDDPLLNRVSSFKSSNLKTPGRGSSEANRGAPGSF